MAPREARHPEPEIVTPHVLRRWPLPDLQESKEARGRALIVGGNEANPGALLLGGEAALRAGAGKVQIVSVRQNAQALAISLPETMVQGVPATADGDIDASAAERIIELAAECEAVLIGPGIFSPGNAIALMDAVVPGLLALPASSRPVLVVDALAMAWVTEHLDGLAGFDGRAVLTPNLSELAFTLHGAEATKAQREEVEGSPREATQELAKVTSCVVSCGGPTTWTAAPDGRTWQGAVGGPGLGTAGSGDVKAGVVTGLAARGADPAQAAVWGSHLHGSAGDRLAADIGSTGFLARELARQVPRILSELEV